jgi:hypothetical protein
MTARSDDAHLHGTGSCIRGVPCAGQGKWSSVNAKAEKLTDRLAVPTGGVRRRMRIGNLPVKKDRRKSKVPFDPQDAHPLPCRPLAVWQDILKLAQGSLGTRRGGFGGEYRFLTVVISSYNLIIIRLGGVTSLRGRFNNTVLHEE